MLKELPGVMSSDVRVSSPNSRKYFLSHMIFFKITATIRLDLLSDYLGLQANV